MIKKPTSVHVSSVFEGGLHQAARGAVQPRVSRYVAVWLAPGLRTCLREPKHLSHLLRRFESCHFEGHFQSRRLRLLKGIDSLSTMVSTMASADESDRSALASSRSFFSPSLTWTAIMLRRPTSFL